MENNDPLEEHPDVRAFIARHAAATTREERLAVLRAYKDNAPVRAHFDQFSGQHRAVSIEELVDEAPTRAAKLAILREDFSEEEAQTMLRISESAPLVKAAPTRAEKLALLRAFLPEERAQRQLRHIASEQAAAVLREYVPASAAQTAANALLERDDFPAEDASERTRRARAGMVGVLLRELPEDQVRGAYCHVMDKIDGGGADAAGADYPEILARAQASYGEFNARLAAATTPEERYAALCAYVAEKVAKLGLPARTGENAAPGKDQ